MTTHTTRRFQLMSLFNRAVDCKRTTSAAYLIREIARYRRLEAEQHTATFPRLSVNWDDNEDQDAAQFAHERRFNAPY